MRIIISPAKKMKTDDFPYIDLPEFLPEAEQLLTRLREMDLAALKALWKCNDAIAELNFSRIRQCNLRSRLTPAILSYQGIQYQYMAPGVFEQSHFEYIQEHLRILSGFYGVLRPFDGVVPYRLEMQAKLETGGSRSLYDFWGGRIARSVVDETDFVLNLASKEYSKCVEPYLPQNVRFITCVFGEPQNGKIIEKGTVCKMARGEMVRWLAENRITAAEDIRNFSRLGYTYTENCSDTNHYVFIKGENRHA